MQCEYCKRHYSSAPKACEGCGAPIDGSRREASWFDAHLQAMLSAQANQLSQVSNSVFGANWYPELMPQPQRKSLFERVNRLLDRF